MSNRTYVADVLEPDLSEGRNEVLDGNPQTWNTLAAFAFRCTIGSVPTPPPYFQADAIDILMRDVHKYVATFGESVDASRGENYEVRGATLVLLNPLARLSVSYSRSKPFSALGELMWYLAKTDSAEFIKYYIPAYEKEEVDGRIQDAYGPRFFRMREQHNQVDRVISLLNEKATTRRAVIQLYDSSDQDPSLRSAPCTCTLQFLCRNGALDLVVTMRSNDVFKGLPHDVFCFTMLQEIVARNLGVNLGRYHHFVGSLHLYLDDVKRSESYLDEGYQATSLMDPMPAGDPWEAVEKVIQLEAQIRLGNKVDEGVLGTLPPYWADIVRMLKAFRAWRGSDQRQMQLIRKEMTTRFFDLFLQEKIDKGPQQGLWPDGPADDNGGDR